MREPRYLNTGTTLQNGRYRIEDVVGAGGFGITYAAWDSVLDVCVAIKEYLPGEFSTRLPGAAKVTVYGGEREEQFKDGLRKFYEESLRLAKFRELGGIVQIFDSFMENGTGYIVMEFLEGETLGMRLEREKKISVAEGIDILLPILDALEAVHREGIIHRDIAPNNIFLCKDGRAKLLDFGAARNATGTYSKSLTVLYKEGYTPEEQYRSRGEQGPWTDVYALAATLYKAITGITPDGALERRRKDKIKKPRKCGVKVSANVERAIMNALNIDYKKRTQSAAILKEELQGKIKVKNVFCRTAEYKVGKIPSGVWFFTGGSLALVGILVILLFAGVIEFHVETFANLFVENGKSRVMNVVNMEEAEARERLAKIGLELEVTEVKYSNKILEGRIISQEEQKGDIVDEGSLIHVVVSKGAGIVEVPDMISRKWELMLPVLEDLCLQYEISEESGIEAPGFVLRQSPEAGVSLEQGQTVTVVVSKGMGYDTGLTSTMGNYVDRVYIEAKSEVTAMGMYMEVEEYAYDDYVAKGCIISQSIHEGVEVHGEDIVYAVVSLGLEPREVPALVGKMQDEASEIMQGLDLTPIYTQVLTLDIPEGTILTQNIPEGSIVDKFSAIEIEVSQKGVEVPQLHGKNEEEVVRICEEEGFAYSISKTFGGDETVKEQNPEAGILVEPGSRLSITIGITEDDFAAQLVDAINAKRSAAGLGRVVQSSEWNKAAQLLADTGKESSATSDGYNFLWAIEEAGISNVDWYTWTKQGYGGCYWLTRNYITTIADADSRIPYSEDRFLHPSMNRIGIAYYGTRLVILIGVVE